LIRLLRIKAKICGTLRVGHVIDDDQFQSLFAMGQGESFRRWPILY